MSICVLGECNDYSILQEIKVIDSNSPTYKIRGSSLLQTLDEINGNRRVYTHAIGEIYVNSANEKINVGRLLGEMDHPYIKNPKDPNEVKRQMMVLWEKVSHKFNKMWIEGNNILGLVETLSNDNGVNLAKIANIDGVPIGFSCRAVGKVQPKNINGQSIMEVVQPTVFVTYDSVTDPSHRSAELKDITDVITNANELNKFRSTMVSESNNVCLDESNQLLDLVHIFNTNNGVEPMAMLIENFTNSRFNNNSNMNSDRYDYYEGKYVQNNMTNLLSEYLSSSDRVSGISSYSTLNESNVHDVMRDYSYNYNKEPYRKVSSAKKRIEQLLGI